MNVFQLLKSLRAYSINPRSSNTGSTNTYGNNLTGKAIFCQWHRVATCLQIIPSVSFLETRLRTHDTKQSFRKPWSVPDYLTLSSDCDEAWKESRDANRRFESDADLSGQYRWENKPLLARLKFWVDAAEDTNFSELIQLFIEFLEAESQHPPEIKQPGRGDDSFKPFLIRRLSQHMESLYGQPFDEAVARISSIVLDLELPLTRDDIRPYITNTGKKFSESV